MAERRSWWPGGWGCECGVSVVVGGCDALIVENMGDLPYLNGEIFPETVAAMTLATAKVCQFGIPTGVQALAGANREALAPETFGLIHHFALAGSANGVKRSQRQFE